MKFRKMRNFLYLSSSITLICQYMAASQKDSFKKSIIIFQNLFVNLALFFLMNPFQTLHALHAHLLHFRSRIRTLTYRKPFGHLLYF